MEKDTAVRPLLPVKSSNSSTSSLLVNTNFDEDQEDDEATRDRPTNASSTSVERYQRRSFGASSPRNRSPGTGFEDPTEDEEERIIREENRRRRSEGDRHNLPPPLPPPPPHRPSENLQKASRPLPVNRYSRSFSPARIALHNVSTTKPRTRQQRGLRGTSRPVLVTAAFLICWYGLSTGLSLYNKWLFGKNYYAFEFPLFVTGVHMCVQTLFASVILTVAERLRPNKRPSTRIYCTKIVPCGLATGFDIGLSNSSMKTISLAFYTMCKSSSLVWIVLFAFMFRLEKPRLSLIGVISLISIGVFMMVMDEATFVLIGFVQVMAAAILGGVRWSLTQMLLDREAYGIGNPISAMFFLAPVMALSLFIASAAVEGYGEIFRSHFFATSADTMHTLSLIVLGGLLASLMILSELYLIAQTSVVTLSVAGIFKEVMTILVSSVVYGDRLTVINIAGLCVSLTGIAAYNYIKAAQRKENFARKGSVGEEASQDDLFFLDANGYSQVVERNDESVILIDKILHHGEHEEGDDQRNSFDAGEETIDADKPLVGSRTEAAHLDKR